MLDIVPTGDTLRRADWRFGMGYWHWFFLAQAHPLPGAHDQRGPDRVPVPSWARRPRTSEAYEDYPQNARDPAAIHAMCEDYRAAVAWTSSRTRPIAALARSNARRWCLWGNRGVIPKWYDPVGIWKEWASNVRGEEVESGHMPAEEAPELHLPGAEGLLPTSCLPAPN